MFDYSARRKERRDRQETQKQQMPPPAPEVLKQEPPVSTAEPTVSTAEPTVSTHSLPQSLKPPPGPLAVPSNSSVESSPSRHYANTQVNKPTVQQVTITILLIHIYTGILYDCLVGNTEYTGSYNPLYFLE